MGKFSPLLIAVLLAACITANVRSDQFDATARAYERALRWSDFRTALAFLADTASALAEAERLQGVRVTSYEPIGVPKANADTSRVVQMVEIHYVNHSNMSERTLTDRQVWEYSDKEQRWKLASPFPAFY